MEEQGGREPPQAFGIDALGRRILDAVDRSFVQIRKEMGAGFTRLHEQLDLVLSDQLRIERTVDKLATRAEFDAAKQALGQAIADAAARVSADIQALRDQIANGQQPSDQDLADIQDDINKLGAIDPSVVPPPGGKQ